MKYHELKVNGVKLPFSFGMAALYKLETESNINISEMDQALKDKPVGHIIELLYAGFSDGHRKAKEKFTSTKEDVADWLDDNPELLDKALEVLNSSMPQTEKKN